MDSDKNEDLLRDGVVKMDEAARVLGVSSATLYLWMRRGQLPYVRVGGQRRVPRAAISKLLRDGLRTRTEGE